MGDFDRHDATHDGYTRILDDPRHPHDLATEFPKDRKVPRCITSKRDKADAPSPAQLKLVYFKVRE